MRPCSSRPHPRRAQRADQQRPEGQVLAGGRTDVGHADVRPARAGRGGPQHHHASSTRTAATTRPPASRRSRTTRSSAQVNALGPAGRVHDRLPHPLRGRPPGDRFADVHADQGRHRHARAAAVGQTTGGTGSRQGGMPIWVWIVGAVVLLGGGVFFALRGGGGTRAMTRDPDRHPHDQLPVLAGLPAGARQPACVARAWCCSTPTPVAGRRRAGAAVRYGLPWSAGAARRLGDGRRRPVAAAEAARVRAGRRTPNRSCGSPGRPRSSPRRCGCSRALLAIVLQAAELRPGSDRDHRRWSSTTSRPSAPGKGLLFSAACAFVYVVIGVMAVRSGESVPAELRILISMFGLLPMPVTGHASNWKYHDYSMVSMELHVLGAAAWTGGLGGVDRAGGLPARDCWPRRCRSSRSSRRSV